jgi:hypothetical protein
VEAGAAAQEDGAGGTLHAGIGLPPRRLEAQVEALAVADNDVNSVGVAGGCTA